MHLSETCEPEAPHLITHVATTDATVADTEVTDAVHLGLVERELLPGEHVVDAGYVTAAHLVTARTVHRIEVIGPVGADTVHGRSEAGHIPQSAFHVDWDTKQVTCPQGLTSVSWSDQRRSSGIAISQVHFAATDCHPCPRRPDCTTAKNHEWGRTLTLRPREQQQALWQRRAEQETEDWKARYNVRAGVEGTISQAVRRTGIRHTRYTGLAKTQCREV
ncbi:transposase [Streptacidiphilus rugosus]|uniref:transposase n=1 Tax=Streptacidiphilus rugosus TaxID=405783 RepID=UPI00068BA11A|nr:transposase [Streptacidiphilus rugosus]